MKQITIMVDDDQQAAQIVEMLSDFDAIRSVDVDPTWAADETEPFAGRIIESDMGPMINHSRVSVYDVMEAYAAGHSIYEIYQIYNLSSSQIEAALAYIAQHRARLEPELKEIKIKMAEREKYYRALAAEREQQIPSEMTPRHIQLKALLAKSRHERNAI